MLLKSVHFGAHLQKYSIPGKGLNIFKPRNKATLASVFSLSAGPRARPCTSQSSATEQSQAHNIIHCSSLQLGSGPGENEQRNIAGCHNDDNLLGVGGPEDQLCGVWVLIVQ